MIDALRRKPRMFLLGCLAIDHWMADVVAWGLVVGLVLDCFSGVVRIAAWLYEGVL